MASKPLIIIYKTKTRKMIDGREYINYKKSFNRHDTPLKPCDHDYYNSDMFPGILRKFAERMQKNRTWCYVDELPEGITIEPGFLATVTYQEAPCTDTMTPRTF